MTPYVISAVYLITLYKCPYQYTLHHEDSYLSTITWPAIKLVSACENTTQANPVDWCVITHGIKHVCCMSVLMCGIYS